MGFSTGTYSGVLRVSLVVVMIGEAVLGSNNTTSTPTLMASPTSISYRSIQNVTLVSQQITPSASSVPAATSSIVPMAPKVTCKENFMEIELDKNMYSHLNSSRFHLRDSSCLSDSTGRTIKLSTQLNRCNTTNKQTDETITYQNEVRAETTIRGNSGDAVTREEALILPFNCTYNRKKFVSVTFEPKRRVDAEEGGFGNFTFLMDFYSNANYNDRYNTSDYPISVQLNDPLYVKYQVLSDKGDLYVFAEKCLATTTFSETSLPSYVFLDKGCAIDQTIDYSYTASRQQTFSIRAFRFIADHPVVYLHCLLLVCHSSYNTSKCAVGCNKNRARRDTTRNERDESRLYHLSSGPLTLKKTTETKTPPGAGASQDVTVFVLASVVGALVVGCCALLILLRRKKRQARKTESDPNPMQLKTYDNVGVNSEDDPMQAKAYDNVGVKSEDDSL